MTVPCRLASFGQEPTLVLTDGKQVCMYRTADFKNVMEGVPMTHKSSWRAKTLALALVAEVGVAVITARGAVGGPVAEVGSGGSTVCAANHGPASGTAQADVSQAVDPGQLEDRAEPTAICRLRPECMSDLDCDVRCGVGQGKCVHSNCPVRICRCS